MTAPVRFAAEGEPCGSCGAPLAADQRYCLACGTRRADARLPFLDILRHDATGHAAPLAAPAAAAVPVLSTGVAERARANTGLIAGVGVLLLAMLIGVLVGSGLGNGDSATAAADPKPVVVSVGGVAAAPAVAATATTGADAAAAADDPASSGGTKKPKAKKAAEKTTVKVQKASPEKLKSLDKLSGTAYQKQIDKLGKNIAVGGTAPPQDNKPAAGGGDFEDIG
jgi:hypothetical protein